VLDGTGPGLAPAESHDEKLKTADGGVPISVSPVDGSLVSSPGVSACCSTPPYDPARHCDNEKRSGER
jgi:hypothetical protein